MKVTKPSFCCLCGQTCLTLSWHDLSPCVSQIKKTYDSSRGKRVNKFNLWFKTDSHVLVICLVQHDLVSKYYIFYERHILYFSWFFSSFPSQVRQSCRSKSLDDHHFVINNLWSMPSRTCKFHKRKQRRKTVGTW